MKAPPIWILILIQAFSVLGDCFGQRVSRVNHKGSRRHMMLALCIISGVQMIAVLGILQLALPASITGAIYVGGQKLPCYQQNCVANGANCTKVEIDCPSQGPGSMFQQIIQHPMLLINGVVNIAYYTGETLLYREPLGLIFLVIASLCSTFLIPPLELMLHEPPDQTLPAAVLVLGILGALFCVIEKQPTHSTPSINDEEEPLVGSSPGNQENPSFLVKIRSKDYWKSFFTKKQMMSLLKSSVRVFIPFLLLSITYAFWFVLQKFVDNQYNVNAFGYNSLDQGLLPFYIIPWLFLTNFIKPIKRIYEDNVDETFLEAIKATWNELSFPTFFLYRLFINARAFAYFLLAVNYDLTVVYLELTLIRVLMSWVGAILVTLAIPKFIGTTPEERKATFAPVNIVLKCLGTAAITASLILLNKE